MAQEPGAAAEGPERQGHKARQQAWAGPTMSLCPACLPTGSGLGHSGTDKRGSGPFFFVLGGGLSQEGGVRVGFTPHFLRSCSQCHTTNK